MYGLQTRGLFGNSILNVPIPVRSQKVLELVGGAPLYESVKGFEAPTKTARTYSYSPDGRLFAYVLPDWYVPTFDDQGVICSSSYIFISVRIHYAENAELLRELPLKNIVEVSFSPRGTYISTWERIGMS